MGNYEQCLGIYNQLLQEAKGDVSMQEDSMHKLLHNKACALKALKPFNKTQQQQNQKQKQKEKQKPSNRKQKYLEKVRKKKAEREAAGAGAGNETEERERRKKKKKEPKPLPPGVDPERWLPKYERSNYKTRKGKKRVKKH